MKEYYLAVDIGASSGRHMLGYLEDGKLKLEEVHRFKNGMTERGGHLCWDHEHLFTEIKNGLKKCGELGKIPAAMGIDTWGVDFVLLDKEGRLLGDTVAYRDSRTAETDQALEKLIPAAELYARTGIQKQSYNTIYQLAALQQESPEALEQAETFLMTPEYFNYLLTGVAKNEYTIASTSGMVNAKTKEWDKEIIRRMGLKEELFQTLYPPKTVVGGFRDEIKNEVGFDCQVILPATHDTGSAVLSVPMSGRDSVYISSGTWSLMGVERMEPDCSEQSRELNFTNEGGVDYRYRYLKNIMGLWIIQSIKKEHGDQYSFNDLEQAARQCAGFPSRINVNDNAFLAPKSMTAAIKDYCGAHRQAVPESIGELMQCVYQSLADSYAETVSEIERMSGKTYDHINLVGGGSQDGYLNELTAKTTQKTVLAGPVEATALGNILAQMLSRGAISSVDEARDLIESSFEIKKIEV